MLNNEVKVFVGRIEEDFKPEIERECMLSLATRLGVLVHGEAIRGSGV